MAEPIVGHVEAIHVLDDGESSLTVGVERMEARPLLGFNITWIFGSK
jgi:hypothetical protein